MNRQLIRRKEKISKPRGRVSQTALHDKSYLSDLDNLINLSLESVEKLSDRLMLLPLSDLQAASK
jgi:hypothetical protein